MYACFKYRLKPQDTKIKVGQTWVSNEGVEAEVINSFNGIIIVEFIVGGLTTPLAFDVSSFLQNFKLKESK